MGFFSIARALGPHRFIQFILSDDRVARWFLNNMSVNFYSTGLWSSWQWKKEREKELLDQWPNDSGARETAAYLASLELLASHYRHQALLKAKVQSISWFLFV